RHAGSSRKDRACVVERSGNQCDATCRCGLRIGEGMRSRTPSQVADARMTETLIPGQITLAQLRRLYGSERVVVELDPACRASVRASAALVRKATEGNAP